MSIFDKPKHEAEKWLKKIGASIEKNLKKVGADAEHNIKATANKATHDVQATLHDAESTLNHTASDLEHHLKEVGDEIADGLAKGFGDLVELAESGLLDKALEKIADYAEKTAFEGDAPIPLRTAYLDIELTDAKLLARTIRQMINDGLPTSKSEWRHIIVKLAPKAIKVKPGIPLIFQLLHHLDLQGLEETALDKVLQEAGLK